MIVNAEKVKMTGKRELLKTFGEDLKCLALNLENPLEILGRRYIIEERKLLIDSGFGFGDFQEHKNMILKDIAEFAKKNFNIELN